MPHSGIRRYDGYDYSRGGSMFISTTLEPRRPLFGIVDHDIVKLSPQGEIVRQELLLAAEHFADFLSIRCFIIMPDHVHLRISWRAGVGDAKQQIGKFVGRWKQLVAYRVCAEARDSAVNIHSIWQHGYHDILCLSERMNRTIEAYIVNNPLKHWLMHCDASLMHVIEPLALPFGNCSDDLWRAVGNFSLLDSTKLVSLRISQKIPESYLDEIVEYCVRGALEKQYIYVSTFFSLGESRVFEALAQYADARMIRMMPTFLELAYRPHGAETKLFAAGRLLILSRAIDPAESPNRNELVDLNFIAADLANGMGGKSVYAQWERGQVIFSAHPARG